MSLTKITHNVLTGEITETDLTEKELAAVKANEEHGTKVALEETARATQRQALLNKLGITAEEAQLLLGGN